MKHILILLAMVAALTACGHRASDGNAQQFAVDSIGLDREDSTTCIKISVDWPTSGNKALQDSIRQYICEELAVKPYEEGKPEAKIYDDGKSAIEATSKENFEFMQTRKEEANSEGWGQGMQFSLYISIMKMDESDTYVTYLSKNEGFMGGAHGYALATGQTFRKSDGKRIGYSTEYNQETESFEIKNQTLFADTKSPKLAALIKEGVRSYFTDFDEDVSSDERLKDILNGVDDVNNIPLPSDAPCFTKEGLSFCYQQYEIAPYAVGLISFTIPYAEIRPFLTADAQDLIK